MAFNDRQHIDSLVLALRAIHGQLVMRQPSRAEREALAALEAHDTWVKADATEHVEHEEVAS